METSLECSVEVRDTLTHCPILQMVTLADLNHLPYGIVLAEHGIHILDNPKRPRVAEWWKEISARNSWTEAMASLYPTK